MEALKCEWCGQESSLAAGHPECRERVQRIWDGTYLVFVGSRQYNGAINEADLAVKMLRGRLFR